MEKIELFIAGLSFSQSQTTAYALILGEKNGKRRLPIIIGGFEAQAIAIEMEKITPTRPLTHDLFKSFAEHFNIKIQEVIIYNLSEGVFYAQLVCNDGKKELKIDARTSDAIALATRFNCPIYTYESILSSAGVVLDNNENEESQEEDFDLPSDLIPSNQFSNMTDDELEELMQKAIEEEDYEKASKIRDELNNRKSN